MLNKIAYLKLIEMGSMMLNAITYCFQYLLRNNLYLTNFLKLNKLY